MALNHDDCEDVGIFGCDPNSGFDPQETALRADIGDRDADILFKLANTVMPFGRYAGRLLVDLPEPYVIWFKKKGWPDGELGQLLAALCELKENGLEALLRPLIAKDH